MEIAREFGPRSYNPEHMDFVTSGNQPSGLPGSAMRRSLPRNILLEASENPSTIEELSMALGSLLRSGRPLSTLTDTERSAWQAIEGRFAHAEGDRVVSDIVVLPRAGMDELAQAIRSHPRYGELEAAVAA